MFSTTAKRIVAATFVGGIVALSPIVAPAANAAPPVGCEEYQGAITTQTTVTISPSSGLEPGDSFTATANVTASDVPVSGGTVEFTYASQSDSGSVIGGSASAVFTAVEGRNTVVATYSGVCPGGADVLGSSASRVPVVAGVEATAGGSGNGGVSGDDAGVGGLAATGLNNQTELFGLLGAGMVAVGGLTLLVHRRRVQA